MQVLHSGGDHWLTVSTIGCAYSAVKVHDNLLTHMLKILEWLGRLMLRLLETLAHTETDFF